MTLREARKILGLGPNEDPRPHLFGAQAARERIAEMVRMAPNKNLAKRYQHDLVEFDQALAVIKNFIKTSTAVEATIPVSTPRRPVFSTVMWLLAFLTVLAVGVFLYLINEGNKATQKQHRLDSLEHMSSKFIENRRWEEARDVLAEIETLDPGSELTKRGTRSIKAGMMEEQNQFVGYWNGQAIAELEAGRLDEAEAAVRKVLKMFPIEKEPTVILKRIATARVGQARAQTLATARRWLEESKPNEAITAARRVLANSPDDPDAKAIIAAATAIIEKQAADTAKAANLLTQAIALDHGEFDQQALDLLREAASLAPQNTEISVQLEKMSSYSRTLRVPGDYATPAEALAVARDSDRIVLSEITWKGPLIVNAAVDLQGAGSGKTIVECAASEGSAITIGPDAKGARVTGIGFRHQSFQVSGSDRFSAALVRGGVATFSNCTFKDASGHGLAVIEAGEATASRCHFSGNGWNGAAAIGKGCNLELRDSESSGNFEHGIESWGGAAVTLINNRCQENSRNGIHTDNGTASAVIEGNQLIANREFGLVLDSAVSGKISGNTARSNLLGGFVIRTAAASLPVTGNTATHNEGPGIVLEIGLPKARYTGNQTARNKVTGILVDVDLSTQE